MIIDTIKKVYSGITNQFSCYEINYVNSNIKILVPLDEANTDYQAIQTWIADGGTVIDNGGGE